MTPLTALLRRVEGATGPDRFWSKVDRRGPHECWEWTGSLNQKGYGQFSVGPKSQNTMPKAHRISYEMLVGPIPEGLHIDHLCRNRKCVNPAHLEPVTAAENNKRASRSKSQCWRGHEFSPENIIVGRGGTRECCACRNERKRQYRRRALIAKEAAGA